MIILRPETDSELRFRVIARYGKWGSFVSVVMESSGSALDGCARYMRTRRVLVRQEIA